MSLNMAIVNLRNLVRKYPDFIGYADERTAQGFQGLHIYIFDKVHKVALDTNVIIKDMRAPLTEEQRIQLYNVLERLRHEQS